MGNMEAVDMFQITSISKLQTMLWAEATATRAAARTRGEAPAMVNLLTALPSTGSSISSINNSINSGSSGSSNSGSSTSSSPSGSRGLEPELLRRLTGGHQCCLEQQAGGA